MTTISHQPLPACLTRDNLSGPCFPSTSRGALAATIALCTIFALTGFNRLHHTDLWGHLNFGRWIGEQGSLPAGDPFAAPASSPTVLHHAWLSQVAGYQVQQTFGNEGLVFGHALLVTAIAGVLMLAVVRRGAPAGWAWLAGAAFFVLDLPIQGVIGPQLFGQLGAALFLLAAAQLPTRRHPLVWLPVVAALWANLHGSVLLGLAILGAFAIAATWNLLASHGYRPLAGPRDAHCGRAWLALVLALVGSCLNPHGPLLLVQSTSFGEAAPLSSMSEWQATSLFSWTGMLLLGSLAATVALVKCSPRKWELYEVLILAALALATFSTMRMLAWWALAWAWVAVPHAAAAWQARRERTGEDPPADEPTAMRTVLAMGVVFATALLAPPSYALVSGRSRGEGAIVVSDVPLYLADEMARRRLAGKIAAPLDWADFLLFKTDGRLRPLVDSHVHQAEPAAWSDYRRIFAGDEHWLDLLGQHHLQYLAVSRQRSPELARRVALENRSPNARLRVIYQDQRCLLAELKP